MSTDENKETMRRVYNAFTTGNLDELDRYVTSDVVDHNPTPGQRPGIDGLREYLQQYRSAFSDLRLEIHDQIAEGDKVVSRLTIHGRHTGPFQGIAPTGKETTSHFVDIVRLAGGKVVERWGVEDSLSFLTQLGAIPEFGEPGRRAA